MDTSEQEHFYLVGTAVERLQCFYFIIGIFTLSAFSVTSMRRPLQFLTVSTYVSNDASELALWMMLSFFSLPNVSLYLANNLSVHAISF